MGEIKSKNKKNDDPHAGDEYFYLYIIKHTLRNSHHEYLRIYKLTI
jgi:hypothetical protein